MKRQGLKITTGMEKIIISKDVFDKVAPHIKPYLKDNCNYCGEKITRDSFGLISRDTTCCNSLLCLSQAVMDEDELKQETQSD